MEVVGLPLIEAILRLEEKNCRYSVERTTPTRDYFKLDEAVCYVVRQHERPDGTYRLMAAAKMRKEVC